MSYCVCFTLGGKISWILRRTPEETGPDRFKFLHKSHCPGRQGDPFLHLPRKRTLWCRWAAGGSQLLHEFPVHVAGLWARQMC